MTVVLPEYIKTCIQALEAAGFAAYAVGGCVRDACLGLQPQDYDLCTAARPDQIRRVFSGYRQVLAGEKHGTVTVLVDRTPVEITAFRTEGDYRDSRHPQWVDFVTDIRQDLARRDFTVNAMAYSPTRGFADPFGGREDLEKKRLRTVGDPELRFTEDALRILRGVRFGVKYRLQVEPSTRQAMEKLAYRLDALSRERVFEELCKLLPLATAQDLLDFAPVLTQAIPALKPCLGFQQHSPHHIYDVYTHTAHVVEAVPKDLALRWAALLHDVGKPGAFTLDEAGCGHFLGHAKVSSQMAREILQGLRAPAALVQEVELLIAQHMTWLQPDRKLLRRRLSRLGEPVLRKLLTLQEADSGGKGTQAHAAHFAEVRAMLEDLLAQEGCLGLKDLQVNGHDLMALGLRGKQIGQTLDRLLELVLEEAVPNDKEILLRQIQEES